MYKVVFELHNAVNANYPILLDALLMEFASYEDDKSIGIDFNNKIGCHTASCIFFEDILSEKSRIIRSKFKEERMHLMPEKQRSQKIKIASGAYKQKQVVMNRFIAKSAFAYFDGDKDRVQYLLSKHLYSIGVKSNQSGVIKSFKIEVCDIDFYNHLLRPLPFDFATQKGFSGQIREERLMPPYYLKSDKVLCICPDFVVSFP